jgi:hypothetical protein
MCTISYLPLKNDHYILTSNRDESSLRPIALPVAEYEISGRKIYFPKDPRGGGTWIATSGDDATLCLMNGGFEPHPFLPHHVYRKSRGLILLDYFQYEDVDDYAEQNDFSNMEPFTLVVLENKREKSPTRLTELRWDGEQLISTPMDGTKPHIWSSAQLYTPRIRNMRQQWFGEWLERNETFTQESILDFHRFAGDGHDNSDLIVDLGELKTISICSIERGDGVTKVVYSDLLKAETHIKLVKL